MRPLCCMVPHTRVPLRHPDHRKKQPPRYWLGSSAEMGPAWPWSIITSTWVQSPTPYSLSSLLLPRLLQHHPAQTPPSPSPASARSSPRGVVSGAQVDEEVPGPLGQFQQVLHAAQVHLQQAGTSPDGHHAPGCHADVGVVLGQLHRLTMKVVGALPGNKAHAQQGARLPRALPSLLPAQGQPLQQPPQGGEQQDKTALGRGDRSCFPGVAEIGMGGSQLHQQQGQTLPSHVLCSPPPHAPAPCPSDRSGHCYLPLPSPLPHTLSTWM